LTVGHSNETLAKITHVGILKLNNDVVLFDVLVVPEYCVSLLSVHKLIKDSKLNVGFDETKCYIQDLRKRRVLGIGSWYRISIKRQKTRQKSDKTEHEIEKKS
ncbi:hypothetical protein Tco_1567247, partial [Tanacetum coccineum]